jgi:hypothetical protein
MSESGGMPIADFLAIAREVEFQRRTEEYAVLYRLGQIMCILTNSKSAKHRPEHLVGAAPKREASRSMSKKETYDVLLGDGETYTLSILNANMIEAVEDEYDQTWSVLFENPRMGVIKSMLLELLRPRYPDMDRKKVGFLLNTRVMPALISIITDMSK